ncbi:hypothetical protein [Falsiroseomonas selenitidurans]|nr:hypothetical protein [Falsiroseomonas selenitidurans]
MVLALMMLPVAGGLAATDPRRGLLVIGLVALVAIAFVLLLAGDPARQAPITARRGRWQAARGVALTFGSATLLGMVLIGLVLWLKQPGPLSLAKGPVAQYAAVAFFAGAVGFGELIARYRDDPSRLFGMRPAAAYIGINLAAGIVALALVQEFAVIGPGPNQSVTEALLAAFGAIAFFRTSLFTARVGDTDVGIGPSTMLKTFLEGSDRLVNRSQASDRADAVAATMEGIDFEKAKATLPTFCLGLVEGLSSDEQRELGEQIARLDTDTKVVASAKARILGVYLLRQVGATVLERAVETLGDTIRIGGPGTPLLEPLDPPETPP